MWHRHTSTWKHRKLHHLLRAREYFNRIEDRLEQADGLNVILLSSTPYDENADLESQETAPSFTLCGTDRIHPDNNGHMVMAYLFLLKVDCSKEENDPYALI